MVRHKRVVLCFHASENEAPWTLQNNSELFSYTEPYVLMFQATTSRSVTTWPESAPGSTDSLAYHCTTSLQRGMTVFTKLTTPRLYVRFSWDYFRDSNVHQGIRCWPQPRDWGSATYQLDNVQDRKITDIKNRLLTVFTLMQPSQAPPYPRGRCIYLAFRDPDYGRIWITLRDAVEVATGYCMIEGVQWWEENGMRRVRYRVQPRSNGWGKALVYLKRVPLPPKSEKPKGGAPPPRRQTIQDEREMGARINRSHKDFVRLYDNSTVVFIDNKRLKGCLITFRAILRMHGATVTVGIPFTIGVRLGLANFKASRRSYDLPSEDLDKYLTNPKFIPWFYCSVLLQKISGDSRNYERTSWFRLLEGGVALNSQSRTRVRDLTNYLGRALWIDAEKRKMSFVRKHYGQILTGKKDEVDGSEFLMMRWVDVELQVQYPLDENLPVDGNLPIGSTR